MLYGLAGLRLVPGGAALTRAWFVYNKPKGPSYTHGGMLMGLGLTGAHGWLYTSAIACSVCLTERWA